MKRSCTTMDAHPGYPGDALPHQKGGIDVSHGRHADYRLGRGYRRGHGREPDADRPAALGSMILQQKDLEETAGKEIIMYRAELVPGGVAGRHTHPGSELAYVLEGTLLFEIDGQPPVTLKAGESVHVPAKQIHNAKNGSTT